MLFITHDIDWVSPLHPYSFVKVVTHGKKWIGLNKVIQPNLFIHQIEKLIEYNQINNINAIWLCGASEHSYKQHGLRYASGNKKYQQIIRKLIKANVEIGLHSVSDESFTNQVNQLSRSTVRAINYHRSHNLKFNEAELISQLSTHHIGYDFSYGHARKFDAIISPPPNKSATHFVPTILFDNAFFYNKPEDVIHHAVKKIEQAIRNNEDVAILFHPENFAVMPVLWDYYQEVITIANSYK